MGWIFNPFTGTFDATGSSGGSTPLGTITNPFPSSGAYFLDSSGNEWALSIDTTGHVVTTLISGGGGTTFLLGGFFPLPQN